MFWSLSYLYIYVIHRVSFLLLLFLLLLLPLLLLLLLLAIVIMSYPTAVSSMEYMKALLRAGARCQRRAVSEVTSTVVLSGASFLRLASLALAALAAGGALCCCLVLGTFV